MFVCCVAIVCSIYCLLHSLSFHMCANVNWFSVFFVCGHTRFVHECCSHSVATRSVLLMDTSLNSYGDSVIFALSKMNNSSSRVVVLKKQHPPSIYTNDRDNGTRGHTNKCRSWGACLAMTRSHASRMSSSNCLRNNILVHTHDDTNTRIHNIVWCFV